MQWTTPRNEGVFKQWPSEHAHTEIKLPGQLLALIKSLTAQAAACGLSPRDSIKLSALCFLKMPIATGNEAWKCQTTEVINLEESPPICCPCRLSYSHTHTTTPSPAAGAAFPLSGRLGATLCLQKWSSIPTSAQKMYFQCVCTKCKKMTQHGKKATEEMLLFFTDYLTSVKHRPESPMSCTYRPMNFSEKYYLTTWIIKPACQPVSKGIIHLSSSFRSSGTDNAGRTRGLLFPGFYVNSYWVWCGKCESYKIKHHICF